jgi:CHAT domain/WD domain, G-beta repeat
VARELTYVDFDVLLERGEEGTYRARVVNAPAGQTPSVAFTLPFTPLELENFVLRVGRPRRIVRRIDAPETAAIKSFGGQLYRALFHDQLEVNLLRSLSEATAQRTGLRIRLRLSDTPELAELPWEFLYDQARNRFLGLSDRTPLVRFLEVPDPPRPLTVSPPLQVLVMIASPSDLPRLDVEQEWRNLRTALAPLEEAGQVQVTRLETATLAALRQQLRRADGNVLHFIGHGGFDPQTQDGVLALEDQTGRSRLVSGQDLGVLLHDHDALRLVLLNACEGARADPSDPFAGTAQSLIQQGIPAVVAMQFEITDPAAISLASELYAAVADGYPLDAALTEARKAIWADGNQVEWATPVLYLRARDGRIFDIIPTTSAAIPPPPPSGRASTTESASATAGGPAIADTHELASPPRTSRPETGWSGTQERRFLHRSNVGIGSSKMIYSVAFTPDGGQVITGGNEKTARIWDVATGQQLLTLRHGTWVWAVASGRDGRVITGSGDKTARIWDLHTDRKLLTLRHDSAVLAVAYSRDGRRVVTGSGDGMARIWDVDTGQQLLTFRHDSAVLAVAYSPDGRRVATGSKDHTARIWDVDTRKQLLTLPHDDWVFAVAYSPDARRLATGSKSGAMLWALIPPSF